jgi:hypothetical protein
MKLKLKTSAAFLRNNFPHLVEPDEVGIVTIYAPFTWKVFIQLSIFKVFCFWKGINPDDLYGKIERGD